MEVEEWRPIRGYETVYEISNHGRIKRITMIGFMSTEQVNRARELYSTGASPQQIADDLGVTRKMVSRSIFRNTRSPEHLLRLSLSHGYPVAGLSRNGVVTQFLVHRVLVETFIGQIPNMMTVNHKNGVRNDNRLDNLEIATQRENNIHSIQVLGHKRVGPKGERARTAKLKPGQIPLIRQRVNDGVLYKYIAAEFNISIATVGQVATHHTWKHIP